MFWKGVPLMTTNKKSLYTRFLRASKGVFRANPILGMGLALPFAVVATTSLQSAVALSITTLLTLLPVCLLMPFIMKLIPQQYLWLDYPLCAFLAALCVLPTRMVTTAISTTLMDSVGVYFSLLCVSSLLFAARDTTRKETDLVKVLITVLRLWLGTALVLLLMGVIREILGYGTIWGKPLTWMKVRFSGVMVSGMGFILLGFMAALGKKIHRSILGTQLWIRRNGSAVRNKMNAMADKIKEVADGEESQKEQSPSEETKEIEEVVETTEGKEQE